MRVARLVICALLLAGVAAAQSTYSAEIGKTLSVELPGSTAAYVLAPSIADASFSNGVLRISAIGAGKTTVVVITPAGVKTLSLVVTRPASDVGADARSGHSESGHYSIQYSSDPQQVTNALDYTRQLGTSFQRLQIADTAFLGSNASFTVLPVLSLQLHTDHYDATLMDQSVNNSALTVQQVVVRGGHFQWHNWSLHAGYASMMAYQNALLAADPEYLFGVSKRFRLSQSAGISANLYYFQNPASTQSVSRNGPVATLAYEYKPRPAVDLKAEVGAGRTAALALAALVDNNQRHISANFRMLPKGFSSLALNSQHGTFGDLQMSENFNSRYSAILSTNIANYDLATLKEQTFSLNSNLSRRVGEHVTLSTGLTYSRFSSPTPAASTFQSISIPIAISYSRRSFSAGAQYLPTSDMEGHIASGYGLNAGVPLGRFQISATYRHDVEVPTVTSILAQVPALQDLLLRAGIVAASLDDILALLNNSAELNALGFGNLVGLNLASTRDDFSAALNWSGVGKHQQRLSATIYDSSSTMPMSRLQFRSESVIYSRKAGASNEVMAAVSLYQTNLAGGARLHPAVQLSFKHNLKSLPFPMLLKHHGNISGHVFFDPDSSTKYASRKLGVDGAEIWLDSERKARTDAHGYYSFMSVPYGEHRLEVKFDSSEPFFFTTDSPAMASVGSVVDFGLNYVKGQIFGFLQNDVGAGIPAVVILLACNGVTQRALSGDDGSFQFRGLTEGSYTVSSTVESYPAGYSLQDVVEKSFEVKPGAPMRAEFMVRALRSIAGIVSGYDASLLKSVPRHSVTVRIPQLGIQTKTDATGHYIFRRLPAGKLTLIAGESAASPSLEVEVPPQPAEIRDINFVLKR